MKNLWIFGAAAVLSLAACSKNIEPADPGASGTKGDLYLTMTITPSSTVGTRTDTPNQGFEVGKDHENKVTDALIVFAKESSGTYTVFKTLHVGQTGVIGQNQQYAATFEVPRKDFLDDMASVTSVAYDVFVIANPTDDILNEFGAGSTGTTVTNTEVQGTFSLTEDSNKYWSADHFLMSNAERCTVTIEKTEIEAPKHNTEGSALNLGTVKIQRAMSRFDIDKSDQYTIFTVENGAQDPQGQEEPQPEAPMWPDVTVTFDAVALINQATVANLFKYTSTGLEPIATGDAGTLTPTDDAALKAEWTAYKTANYLKLNFTDEAVNNYVFSPIQTKFTKPLFGDGSATKSVGTDYASMVMAGTQNEFGNLSYDLLSTVTTEDETFTYPGKNNQDVPLGTYRIWRYCMENTIINKDNQYHGNTTGVVFRAKMTSSKLTNQTKAVYAYNSVIIGDAQALKTYATSPKNEKDDAGIYELVSIRYNAVVKAAIEENKAQASGESWKFEDGFKDVNGWKVDNEGNIVWPSAEVAPEGGTDYYAMLDAKLVEREFTIYRPTQEGDSNVFYCYYPYYNRHNDNSKITTMGPMEFATVRNNVYKLRVNSVLRLGHPGKPGDDPDPDDPNDPDEEDHFYFSVACEILPWEVRINGIDF